MSISVRNGPGDRALTRIVLPSVDHGQLPSHRQHRPLGSGVGDLRGSRAHRRHKGRCVDDRTAARPTHSGDLMPTSVQDAFEVHGQGLVDGLLGSGDGV